MIPALRNAEFVRYGVMHRNTYLNSPQLLDRYYRLRRAPRIRFAGQMTGVEGYGSRARPARSSVLKRPRSCSAWSRSISRRKRPSARCPCTFPAAASAIFNP